MSSFARLLCSLISAIVFLWGVSVQAADFHVAGYSAWTYQYQSQLGSDGFFGPYNVDNSSKPLAGQVNRNGLTEDIRWDLSSANYWIGQSGLVSGATSGRSTLSLALYPTISINQAIYATGTYSVGPYVTSTAPDTGETIAVGQWTAWALYAETPLGKVSYGKRSFLKGLGLQFGTARSEEFLEISTDYITRAQLNQDLLQEATGKLPWEIRCMGEAGVLRLAKELGAANPEGTAALWMGWACDPLTPQTTTDSLLRFSMGVFPWRIGSNQYWNIVDLNAVRSPQVFLGIEYTVANLRLGVGGLHYYFRAGPESQRIDLFRAEFAPRETSVNEGWLYFMYYNGRIKIGSELDFHFSTTRYQGSQNGWLYVGNGTAVQDNPAVNGQSFFAPDYIESLRFMTSCNLYAGPSRFSVFYSVIPGPDRRHGIIIDRQPVVLTPNSSARIIFEPYSMILGPLYSGGVGRNGDISDASVIAVAYDYKMAANLDVSVSALHAKRLSHGYGWGYIRPRVPTSNFPSNRFGTVEMARRGTYVDPAPAIPDDDLGWEFTSRLRWQLLQNWTLKAKAGYWIPGRWFKFACIDKAVNQPVNWDTMTNTDSFQYPYGINPNRHIDPVFALSIDTVFEW